MRIIKNLTRRGRLESELKSKFTNKGITNDDIKVICDLFDYYENNNLQTIDKLRKEKKIEMRRINGAIKQFLNVHPILTKELVSSLGKRIYGAILSDKKEKTIVKYLKSLFGFNKK